VNTDELFNEWRRRKREPDMPAGFADRVMALVRASRAAAAPPPKAASPLALRPWMAHALKAAAVAAAAALWGCKFFSLASTVLAIR
jgi:hypothetical protein